MQVDDTGVRDPRERCHLVDDDVRLALLAVIRPGLDPRRSMRRFVLAPEGLSVDAVGEHLHREWTVAQVRQHVRRHPHVVLDHVALGDAVRGPQDLIEIRERKSAAGDLPVRVAVQRSQRVPAPHVRPGPVALGAQTLLDAVGCGGTLAAPRLGGGGVWPAWCRQVQRLVSAACLLFVRFGGQCSCRQRDFPRSSLRDAGRGGGCGRRGGGGCRRGSSRRSGLRRRARA